MLNLFILLLFLQFYWTNSQHPTCDQQEQASIDLINNQPDLNRAQHDFMCEDFRYTATTHPPRMPKVSYLLSFHWVCRDRYVFTNKYIILLNLEMTIAKRPMWRRIISNVFGGANAEFNLFPQNSNASI